MKRASSSRNPYDVFDFDKEEERVESESARILKKFKKHKPEISPITKYKFLEFFVGGTITEPKEFSAEPIDVDAIDIAPQCTTTASYARSMSLEDGQGCPDTFGGPMQAPKVWPHIWTKTQPKEISNEPIDVDDIGSAHQCTTTALYARSTSLEDVVRGTKIHSKEFSNEPIELDDIGTCYQCTTTDLHVRFTSLEDVVRGTKAQPNEVDVDDISTGLKCTTSVSHAGSMSLEGGTCPNNLDPGSFLLEENSLIVQALISRVNSANSRDLNCSLTQSLSDGESDGRISDDDDSIRMSSSSTSALDHGEIEVPLEKPEPEFDFGGCEIDNVNKMVAVSPDFIMYRDIYCTQSLLTFSCSSIELEGSISNGSEKTFRYEWTIDDIIKIESRWCAGVETASVNLFLKSNGTGGAGNADEISGIEVLKFAVYDPHWSEVQGAIESLNARYKDTWSVVVSGTDPEREEDAFLGQKSILFAKNSTDPEREEDAFLGQKSILFAKNSFNVPFENLIYPKGDPDAVSISRRDVELLQPETFINDTIIDFYIKYLKHRIEPEKKHRFHFFNSFFFRKLADLDKDSSSTREGRAAFQRVRKWTRKVNLFEKDFIFIPVNFSLHWSLIVICHPGEVAKFKDEEVRKSSKVPCILHMDSIKGSHKGLKNLVRSYLWEEWRERQCETVEDVSSKFLNIRFLPLELPQQENSFDCGLFLLHFVELFLEMAPVNFNPFNITKFSNFLNKDWFPPAEVSCKRAYIKKLIYELFEDSHEKVCPVANEQDTTGSTKRPCLGNSSNLGMGIHSLQVSSPSKGANSDSTLLFGVMLNELHATSPTMEVDETEMQIDEADGGAKLMKQHNNGRDSCYGSRGSTQNSSEIEVYEDDEPVREKVGELNPETEEGGESFLTSSEEQLSTCVVEDSQEENDDEKKVLATKRLRVCR